ncbi:MAG TPA: hypothetical protein VK623_05730 [Flavobacterium sp.]|nr:hypothetical protein [Flavobacterium sp.]
MPLDRNTGGTITVEEAQALVRSFSKKFPNEIKALYIGSENVQTLIDQDDCMGVRIYNGYDDKEGRINLFMVGVDSNGNDMIDIIMDRMSPCPPNCDPTTPFM